MNTPINAIASDKPTVIRPNDTDSFDFGGLGVEWKIARRATEGRFSVVHHPIAPRALAAPLHLHHREDEYSFVLKGRLGALLGEHVVEAAPGDWVFKPRAQWHTFWNGGETPCEIIEVISPAGFEEYFREVAAHWGNVAAFAAINEKYALEMRFDSVPGLCQRFGLTFPNLG
jgi:mannose-6-phosphate isomerase-like protein (cupin superfamily)